MKKTVLRKKILRKKIRKTIGCFGVVTVVICIFFCLIPIVKGVWSSMMGESEGAMVQENGAEAVVQTDNVEQLNVELPEGINYQDIVVEADVLNQTIYVRFEEAVEDYLEHYQVKDSSQIADLFYYEQGEEGVLEISLKEIREYALSFKSGYLNLYLADPREIYDTIVVVDAGHGGKDPGAVVDEVYEKDINLNIVVQLKKLFDDAEIEDMKIYYTRLGDTNPALSERVGLANRLEADIFISVHNNTSTDTAVNGTLVLYNPEDEGVCSSERLAQICLEQVNASTGSHSQGLADGNYVHIVRESKVPVALIEVGYMTNKKEFDKLQDSKYCRMVAQGIYTAILNVVQEEF